MTLESKENYPRHTKTVQNSLGFMPEVKPLHKPRGDLVLSALQTQVNVVILATPNLPHLVATLGVFWRYTDGLYSFSKPRGLFQETKNWYKEASVTHLNSFLGWYPYMEITKICILKKQQQQQRKQKKQQQQTNKTNRTTRATTTTTTEE